MSRTTTEVEQSTLVHFARWVKDDERITEAWIAVREYEPRRDEYVNPEDHAGLRYAARLYVAGMRDKNNTSLSLTVTYEPEPLLLCEGAPCPTREDARAALVDELKARLLARHADVQCALHWLVRVGLPR